MKITHSAEPHEPRYARRSSIEPIERVLPFCCNLISQGLGSHYTAPAVDGRANLTPFGNCRDSTPYTRFYAKLIYSSTHLKLYPLASPHLGFPALKLAFPMAEYIYGSSYTTGSSGCPFDFPHSVFLLPWCL